MKKALVLIFVSLFMAGLVVAVVVPEARDDFSDRNNQDCVNPKLCYVYNWVDKANLVTAEFIVQSIIKQDNILIGYIDNFTMEDYFDPKLQKIVRIQVNHPIENYLIINKTIYPPQRIVSLNLSTPVFNKIVDLPRDKYTYSIKNKVLTVKDLNRGGTWNDKDLDSCYNIGVPCKQYDLTDPTTISKIKEYQDTDRIVGVNI